MSPGRGRRRLWSQSLRHAQRGIPFGRVNKESQRCAYSVRDGASNLGLWLEGLLVLRQESIGRSRFGCCVARSAREMGVGRLGHVGKG